VEHGERSVKFFDRLQPVALLTLRVALAIIFIFHGYPKLTHTHGDLQKLFVEHGMPGYFALVAGVIETFGGGLLLIGLLARPAAMLLAIEMTIAIWKVHSVHGIYSVRDYEFPLALATACFVLASVGAGLISVDHFVFEGGGGGGGRRGGGGGGSYKVPKIKYKGHKRDRDQDD
jgi:putative oxidoreductase